MTTDPLGPRCPITDMHQRTCAHCTGATLDPVYEMVAREQTGERIDHDNERVVRAFLCKYDGRCQCGSVLDKNKTTAYYTNRNRTLCEECASDLDPTAS